jgi:hypothetical protein
VKILAIDPGTTQSGWIVYDPEKLPRECDFGITPNEELLRDLEVHSSPLDAVVIEMVACYGLPVGAEVFETVCWIGRFMHAAEPFPVTRMFRKEVKMHLCHSMKAKDSNIRQALVARFGPAGRKKEPGGTYGISKDVWSALAIAVTYCDQHGRVGA